jgi:hypothetical protein
MQARIGALVENDSKDALKLENCYVETEKV